MAVYVSNAFSLSMLASPATTLRVEEVSVEDVKKLLSSGFKSSVGHASTAQIMSQLLGVEVPCERTAIQLGTGDTLVVFQLLTRLPEGRVLSAEEIKSLPAKWLLVEVV